MKRSIIVLFLACNAVLMSLALVQSQPAQKKATFSRDVQPIIKKYCLPCHLSDSENPSGLAMDSYEMLRKGGENGDPIEPGKPEESLLYLKLQDPPPLGKQMPRNRKTLEAAELRSIKAWIEQGAEEE